MQITINVPDALAQRLTDRLNLPQRSLELLAIEAYRHGIIGSGEVGQMLGFSSRWETYNFLQTEHAEPPAPTDDLDCDRATLQTFLDAQ
jgi:hypothetical protein